MRYLLISMFLVFLAVPALAGAPQTGVYLSDDMGGQMLTGRFSESWVGMGGPGQIGNTINAQSYDPGFGLGSQWRFSCGSIAFAPVLVSDTRDLNGTGEVTWRTEYAGASFWLSKDGPWGDGSEDYEGVVNTFTVTATYMYVAGQVLGIRSNTTTSGQFTDFGDCFEYTINNTAFFGDTETSGPLPGDFPDFLDDSCQTGVLSRGGWGSVTEIALRILGSCTVATEESTWGAVKALYRE